MMDTAPRTFSAVAALLLPGVEPGALPGTVAPFTLTTPAWMDMPKTLEIMSLTSPAAEKATLITPVFCASASMAMTCCTSGGRDRNASQTAEVNRPTRSNAPPRLSTVSTIFGQLRSTPPAMLRMSSASAFAFSCTAGMFSVSLRMAKTATSPMDCSAGVNACCNGGSSATRAVFASVSTGNRDLPNDVLTPSVARDRSRWEARNFARASWSVFVSVRP